MKRILVSSLVAATGLAVGCGGGAQNVGDAVAPEEDTAQSALGVEIPECSGKPDYAEPLVVDLPSNARLDLEVSMKGGLAVVSYDCKSLKVLNGCKVEGTYEFAGVSRKEQVVQMTSADELAANLPLSVAKLSAEMQRGKSIDLAIVMVGKRSATQVEVLQDQLVGTCDGATHFVRAASLGAFSVATGSKGKVAALAEVFGASAGGKSEATRRNVNKDGNVDSCKEASPSSASPPDQCQSAIRVELLPVVGSLTQTKKGDPKKGNKVAKNPCPEGYQFADGLCTKNAEKAYLCDPKSESDCQRQCDKGHAQSCRNYALLLGKGRINDAAAPFHKKACEGGVGDSCGAYGMWTLPDDHKKPGADAKTKEGLKYLEMGCDLGSGDTCDDMGVVHEDDLFGLEDHAKAVKFFKRSCALGAAIGCWHMAHMHFKGHGVAKNPIEGLKYFARACDGGSADECGELGEVVWKGMHGAPKSEELAKKALTRACQLDKTWCDSLGDVFVDFGDTKTAIGYYERGCPATWSACMSGGNIYAAGKGGVAKDEAKAKQLWSKSCENGEGDDAACKKLGIKMKPD